MFDSLSWFVVLGLSVAAFFAGLIDSMVGGGGLIQIPSMFSLLGSVSHPTIFGTNKVASVVGTTSAAFRYGKAVRLPWNAVVPAALAALLCSFAGSYTVTFLPPGPLKMGLPVLLLLVAIYTFTNKNLGQYHAPKLSVVRERWLGFLMGAVVGFYDGFFGPGTGSFLMVGFVVIFGFDFLVASAGAKVVNIACNLASLAWFAPSGHVMWGLGLWMAFFNLAGSQVGSRLAIKKGAGFVRYALLGVVGCLIIKTAWDAYSPLFL